jgi:hypothetical protein
MGGWMPSLNCSVGHDGRLEDGDRHPQHQAARLGDEVGHRLLAAHQRHLAKGVAGPEAHDDVALAAGAGHGHRQLALEQDAEEGGIAELDHASLGS